MLCPECFIGCVSRALFAAAVSPRPGEGLFLNIIFYFCDRGNISRPLSRIRKIRIKSMNISGDKNLSAKIKNRR